MDTRGLYKDQGLEEQWSNVVGQHKTLKRCNEHWRKMSQKCALCGCFAVAVGMSTRFWHSPHQSERFTSTCTVGGWSLVATEYITTTKVNQNIPWVLCTEERRILSQTGKHLSSEGVLNAWAFHSILWKLLKHRYFEVTSHPLYCGTTVEAYSGMQTNVGTHTQGNHNWAFFGGWARAVGKVGSFSMH